MTFKTNTVFLEHVPNFVLKTLAQQVLINQSKKRFKFLACWLG